MRQMLRRSTCLLLLILILVSSAAPALASYKAYFSSGSRIYAKATPSSKSVKVSKGTKVTIVAIKGDVAMIRKNGVTAYCDVRKLTLSSPIHVYAKRSCKIYSKASTSSKSMAIPVNTDLYITGKAGGFFRIKNKKGSITAWIRMSDVSSSKVKVAGASKSAAKAVKAAYAGSSKTGKLLIVARSLLGRPYSSSANPPSSFDCSRFVSYCYKQIGVSVSPVAKTLGYSKHTRITSISALKAGDIVVFNTNPNDDDLSDHVGIYIGSGQFVHASSSGGKVMISSFTKYYKGCFSWGLRVL
ncbi:MAG: C40 family peptidase [Clostridia bacterium]|nr:C40 family peptidase [Clostridia bacterium]